MAGCESVLEKRVLLSAVASGDEPEVQPAVQVEDSVFTDSAVLNVFLAVSPSGDEVKFEANGLAETAQTVDPDGDPSGAKDADGETEATDPEAAGPAVDVKTTAAASADSLRFDLGFAEVFDDVLAGLDEPGIVTAIPADVDAVFKDPGFAPLTEAKSPLVQGEQPSLTSEAGSSSRDVNIEPEVAEGAESNGANDDRRVGLGGEDQSVGRSAFRSLQAQRQLLESQKIDSERAFHSTGYARYRSVDSVRSMWLNSAFEEQSESHFRLGHQFVLSSSLSSNSGQPFELFGASQLVWSGLTGLSHSIPAQYQFDFTRVAANSFPVRLAHLDLIDDGSQLTQFGSASEGVRGFVEVAEPTNQDPFEQPTKHVHIRIEAEIAALSADTVASDDPPERSDIPGVWQSLRFDCNPRGPPGEDALLISEFTRQAGDGKQLQQLRFSIAPRGPSVAFCS
ncbi:MAG: hypothetical protein ABJZ55_24210 [Fuerstiella sp.]